MTDQQEPKENARQRSKSDTSRRLLEAGAKLFSERGSNNTRIVDVADLAGVAVGTLYLHFKDKDTLLKEILKAALGQLKLELAKLPPESEAEGYAQVEVKMTALANYTSRYPNLAAVLFNPANLASPSGKEAMDFLVISQEKGLFAGISEGYYRGDLHSGMTSRAMVGIMVNVLGWWANYQSSASIEEVVRVLTELRMKGLQSLV